MADPTNPIESTKWVDDTGTALTPGQQRTVEPIKRCFDALGAWSDTVHDRLYSATTGLDDLTVATTGGKTTLTLTGGLSVAETTTLTGVTTLKADSVCEKDLAIAENLEVIGTTSLNGAVTIHGALTVEGALSAPNIKYGTVSVTPSTHEDSDAARSGTASVTFDTPFNAVPSITITPVIDASGVRRRFSIYNTLAGSFNVKLYVDSTSETAITVHWIAIGT
jgi:hypothetical protein